MAELAFEPGVAPVEIGAKTGRCREIGAGSEDAEGAAAAGKAEAVDRVRGLTRGADGLEDLGFVEIEDGEPVVPLASGPGVAGVELPGGALGAVGALVAADAHGVDDAALETRVGLEVTPEFPLDRRSLEIRRAVPTKPVRKAAAAFDAVEQGFAGGDVGEKEWDPGGKRRFDVAECAGPFDFGKRGVNGDELIGGDVPGQQDRHGLRVLAA